MNVWIVRRIVLFGPAQIVGVYSNEKEANKFAASSAWLVVSKHKVRKKVSKALWASTSPSRTGTRTAGHKPSGTRATTAASG